MSGKTVLLSGIMVLAAVFWSCGTEPYDVDLLRIENGIATFEVKNNTDQDLTVINFELSYYDSDGEIIRADTVDYSMSENSPDQVFLVSGGETFITQSIPGGTVSASGRILSVE